MTASAPYPPIESLACIGDRRTAALVDRRGEIGWLCLPNFDSAPLFGGLLDRARGGAWRFGPSDGAAIGHQEYLGETAILRTRWRFADGEIELLDTMLDPADERRLLSPEARVVLRRMRCVSGRVGVSVEMHPRPDFGPAATWREMDQGWALTVEGGEFSVWSTLLLQRTRGGLSQAFEMTAGEEAWMVAGLGLNAADWNVSKAQAALTATEAWWHETAGRLTYSGKYRDAVTRAALTMHLLSFAPSGALVAAPTTSLPERLGGDRNYDYRFAWVRDVSLGLESVFS